MKKINAMLSFVLICSITFAAPVKSKIANVDEAVNRCARAMTSSAFESLLESLLNDTKADTFVIGETSMQQIFKANPDTLLSVKEVCRKMLEAEAIK